MPDFDTLVINATGLGKDAPGSPISDAAQFPLNGIAWDFNYRGDLVFLVRRDHHERHLDAPVGRVRGVRYARQAGARVISRLKANAPTPTSRISAACTSEGSFAM